jgi:hypothetical protein
MIQPERGSVNERYATMTKHDRMPLLVGQEI